MYHDRSPQPSSDAIAWARLHGTLADSVDGLGSTRIPVDVFTGTYPLRTPAETSRMMAPSDDPAMSDLAAVMQANVDRIEIACLVVGLLMFLMIAGRVAFALVVR